MSSNKQRPDQSTVTAQKPSSSDSNNTPVSTTGNKLENHQALSTPKETTNDSALGNVLADAPPTQTKMAVATDIYKMMIMRRDVTRKDIIERLVADADLSPAAASTYYQLIKRKHKA